MKEDTGLINTDYLKSALDINQLPETVKGITRFLGPRKRNFDGIAICGMSGALVGPLVSLRLKKPILVVRKDNNHHSTCKVEGDLRIQSYVIIDDSIDTGKTIKKMQHMIKEFNGAKLQGIVLYDHRNAWKDDAEEISELFGVWVKGTNEKRKFYLQPFLTLL